MPNSASHVQQSLMIIEIRPYRNGWQGIEASGVQPYWIGKTAKEDASGYATARAKFGRGEIRVLNADGSSVLRNADTMRYADTTKHESATKYAPAGVYHPVLYGMTAPPARKSTPRNPFVGQKEIAQSAILWIRKP